jgi:hypothetical protein
VTDVPHPDLMQPSSPRPRGSFPRTRNGRREMLEHYVIPYGLWLQEDGRAVVFNRQYDPIFIVHPGGRVVPVMGGWVRSDGDVGTHYFFGADLPRWRGPRDHERWYDLLAALHEAALATGYGYPPPRPDLLGWLIENTGAA